MEKAIDTEMIWECLLCRRFRGASNNDCILIIQTTVQNANCRELRSVCLREDSGRL